MKVIAINGSPRKEWNTATLLKKALDGASSVGAETELIHLYDLNYKGCTSCFACKKKSSPTQGHCSMKDDLRPVLEKILTCDALILGSPLYFGNVTGEMLSMMERMLFSVLTYNQGPKTLYSRDLRTGFIYTMGMTEELILNLHNDELFKSMKVRLQELYNGASEYLLSCDTYQFTDYAQYEANRFDAEEKKKVRETQFPIDCRNAYEMGVRLGTKQLLG